MYLVKIESADLDWLLLKINQEQLVEHVVSIMPPDKYDNHYRAIYKKDVLGEITRSLKQMGSVTQSDSAVDEGNVK